AGEEIAQRAIHRRARRLRIGKEEREIHKPELRHPLGQVAGGLIAEGEEAVLDQPQDILGAIAEIHDVPDVLDLQALAELGREPVADEFERAAKAGGRGPVTSHADLDPIAHACPRGCLIATAMPEAARPSPNASRMPTTPVAAARSPASAGKTICPMRLPVIRKVSAVPQACAGARWTTLDMVSVEAMP